VAHADRRRLCSAQRSIPREARLERQARNGQVASRPQADDGERQLLGTMRTMHDYLAKLFLSPLPAPLWVVAALWLIVHCISFTLARRSLGLGTAEQKIVMPPESRTRPTVRLFAVQIACAAAVFLYSVFAGGALASAFAGGWFIAAAVGLSLNVRSCLIARARNSPGSLRGRVDISVDAALRERAADLFAGASACVLAAVIVPHPALLGGAWILGAGALGYSRRARSAGVAVTM